MRIIYGTSNFYEEVTNKLHGIVDLRNITYNEVLGDPVPSFPKQLVIEDDRGQCLLKLNENTPIVINMHGQRLPVYMVSIPNDDRRHLALQYLYSLSEEECLLLYMEGDTKTLDINYEEIFSLLPTVSLVVPEMYSDGTLPIRWWCTRSSYVRQLPPPTVDDTHQWIYHPTLNITDIYIVRGGDGSHPHIGIPTQRENDRYLLVDLNYTNHHGLTNQILILTAGLLIGSLTRRKVVVSGFYPDYNRRDTVHIGELIDTERYNEYLKTIGTLLIDVRDVHQLPWRLMDNWSIPYSVSSVEDRVGNYPYVLLPSVPFDFGTFVGIPDDRFLPLYMCIRRNLPFSSYILDQASRRKAHTSCHLRLEDDMMVHMQNFFPDFNEQSHIDKVYTSIRDTCTKEGGSVYICTGLGKYPNKNNHILDRLKEELCVVEGSSISKGREFDAAIDMAVCLYTEVFIGPGRIEREVVLPTMTTFSSFIADLMMHRGKKILLI